MASTYAMQVPAKARQEVIDFVVRRLEQLLIDGGATPEAGEHGCRHLMKVVMYIH